MYTALFYVQAALQLALLWWLLRIRRDTGAVAAAVLLVPVAGLIYDNMVVALGSTLGLGSTLQNLSWPRFWIHWLVGSWMIIVSGSILRLAGISWARQRHVMGGFCLLTAGLMACELPQFWHAQLFPVCEKGLIRYATAVSTDKFCLANQVVVKGEVPLPSVITALVVMACGAVLLWRRRFAWMLIGGLLMFVSASPLLARFKLDNLGEVLIAGGCTWAIARFASVRA